MTRTHWLPLILFAACSLGEAAAQAPPRSTAADCFDDLYSEIHAAFRRFPRDEWNRQSLEQAALDRFTIDLSTAGVRFVACDVVYQELLEHLVLAGRFDPVKRAATRQTLVNAASQAFTKAMEGASDLTARAPEECYQVHLQHMRRAKFLFGLRSDLRTAAETAATTIFSFLLGVASPVTPNVDYPALFTRNARMIDIEFPLPGADEATRDPKAAAVKAANQGANAALRSANWQVLQRATQTQPTFRSKS